VESRKSEGSFFVTVSQKTVFYPIYNLMSIVFTINTGYIIYFMKRACFLYIQRNYNRLFITVPNLSYNNHAILKIT